MEFHLAGCFIQRYDVKLKISDELSNIISMLDTMPVADIFDWIQICHLKSKFVSPKHIFRGLAKVSCPMLNFPTYLELEKTFVSKIKKKK